MTESTLHRSMKAIVRAELEAEGYGLVEEPLFPPSVRLHWTAYRPDMLGFRRANGVEEIVIVECETHPNMKRFRAKNHSTLWFQSSVSCEGSIRRILAIPRGRLRSVDLRLRSDWEVWILGGTRPVDKFGTFERASSITGPVPASEATAPLPPLARDNDLQTIRARTNLR